MKKNLLATILLSISMTCFANSIRSLVSANKIKSIENANDIVEVEYLESTGKEFIVIPFEFHNGTIRIEGRAISMDERPSSGTSRYYLGTGTTAITQDGIYLAFRLEQQYRDICGRYSNIQGSNASKNYSEGFILEYDTYTYDMYRKRRNGNTQNWFEGTMNLKPWNEQLSQFNIYQFVLFGARSDGEELYAARIYFMRFYVDTNDIYDLIPVRIKDVGYMYDKVSGQLFTNQGNGAFIIGPDKH